MSPHQKPVRRHILIYDRNNLLDFRKRVPPVAHEIAEYSKVRNEVHARSLHAQIRRIPYEGAGSAAGFYVCENRVPWSVSFVEEAKQ